MSSEVAGRGMPFPVAATVQVGDDVAFRFLPPVLSGFVPGVSP